LFEAEVESRLADLADKPVLFVWGTEDFAFQQRELDRFKSYFPNHVYHPLPASHFWQDEQAEAASGYIRDWGQRQGWLA
jgi:pimeloyl-ACP methyl ester carboxylesterase